MTRPEIGACDAELAFLFFGCVALGNFPAAWDVSVFAGMTVFDSLRYDLIP
jgi:hypothetical protein